MSVLDDQLAQVERDLSEIDGQVAAGELDLETAERLRATYRGEADGLRAQNRLAGLSRPADRSRRAGASLVGWLGSRSSALPLWRS